MSDSAPGMISWAVAELPMRGETVSGDAVVVEVWPEGALVAAIDALGHGPEAAAAARAASDVLRNRPSDSPAALIEKCHLALRKTRGIAISLASFDARHYTLTWIGIGNVEAVLFRADPAAKPPRESALLRGGIVGGQIPPLRPTSVVVRPDDTLVMATDGVSSRFATVPCENLPPQDLSGRILRQYGKETDDALVLVARFPGGQP